MKRNTDFGKLNAERTDIVEYAPSVIVDENKAILAPTEDDYKSSGWKRLIAINYPTEPAGENKHWEADGLDETDTTIIKRWRAVDNPVIPKNYSVADLFFWLRLYDAKHTDAPKGQATIDWLNAANLYTIAVTTREVSEDNELFTPTLAALKKDVGFTDEDIAEALTYAEIGGGM